jgi:hypothetical protein
VPARGHHAQVLSSALPVPVVVFWVFLLFICLCYFMLLGLLIPFRGDLYLNLCLCFSFLQSQIQTLIVFLSLQLLSSSCFCSQVGVQSYR